MPRTVMPEPKSVVIALNEGNDIAVTIDRREIGGVARGRSAGGDFAICFPGVDELRTVFGIFLREQAFHRHFGKARIGVVTMKVSVGQLHGFDFLVEFAHAEGAVGRGG